MVKREETLLKMFPEEIRKRIVQIPDWFEQVQDISFESRRLASHSVWKSRVFCPV
ncbi:MAG: hypothetical protein V8S27_01075 [Lachnospiraceae bacterium]